MKKTLLYLLALAPTLSFGQNLLYEQEYTRNPVTPSTVKTIPLKDGGLFVAYSRSPKAAIKSSHVIMEFDNTGKKVFEKNTEIMAEFKNKDMCFVYNPTNGYVYGIHTYLKKGAALADIMILQRDGSYSAKTGIPTPTHVLNAFLWEGKLVLLGLNAESLKQPSGEYEAVILNNDFVSTPKKLTLPAFTNEAGSKKNKLVGMDGKNLYFATEKISATDGKVSYEFTQYDWNANKVLSTKTINLDLGENTKREATADLQNANTDLVIFDDYLKDFPLISYNKTENAFFIYGSYGKGFTTYEAGREHAGVFMARVNTNLELEWKNLMAAPAPAAGSKIYTSYTTKHQLLLTGKNKNYLVCNSSEAALYEGSIAEIDLKTGKEKSNVGVSGENIGLILPGITHKETLSKIPDLQVKAEFRPYFIENGDKTYLVLNHEKKVKMYVYGF